MHPRILPTVSAGTAHVHFHFLFARIVLPVPARSLPSQPFVLAARSIYYPFAYLPSAARAAPCLLALSLLLCACSPGVAPGSKAPHSFVIGPTE